MEIGTILCFVFTYWQFVVVLTVNKYSEEGSNVILICKYRSSNSSSIVSWFGPPTYRKYSQGQTISTELNSQKEFRLNITGNHTIGEFNLQISNFQQQDEGKYKCQVSNIPESKEEIDLKIKVVLTDVIIVPSGHVAVESSQRKQFNCSARSLPLPAIVWNLDSNQIFENSTSTTNLTVTSVYEYVGNKDDTGKIIYCTATSDGVTVRSVNAQLNVTYGPGTSPKLDPPDTSIEKNKGEDLDHIRCSADCNPSCQYQWTKDSGQLVVHGDTLYIQSLKKTDHGTYRCKAWNGIGENSIDIMLIINYGPEYINLLPNNFTYKLQEFTSPPVITCYTACRPNCLKYWIGPKNKVKQSNTLNIKNISRSQAGTYKCYANNTVSSLESNNVTIIVTYGPGTSQQLDPPKTSVEKNMGDNLDPIRCTADCNPSCQYQWTNDNDHVVIPSDTLSIQSLNKTDHGTYRCRAWNGIGESSIDVMLTVNYGPEYINLSPNNFTYKLQEFTSLPVITCHTECRPSCFTYWIGPKNQVKQSDTVNIGNITRTQAGTYSCFTNNSVGRLSSNDVVVIVTYGASVVSLETTAGTHIFNQSQDVNMTCNVIGVPQPKIKWTFDGKEINNQENRTSYVFNAECEKTGNYTCIVENSLGYGKETKGIFVQCCPRISRDVSTGEKVGVKDGEGLNITVTLIAFPKPDIYWSFKNSTVLVNNSFGKFEHTSYLYKPTVKPDDFGIYSLMASNEMGNIMFDVIVGAERSPDPPVIISARCDHLTLVVFWNASFNGGDKQSFIIKATKFATTEPMFTKKIEYFGKNPLNTTIYNLPPGTLFHVVAIALNDFGNTESEGIANCTTDLGESDSSNTIAISTGAGGGSALIVLGVVFVVVVFVRRRHGSNRKKSDQEPMQSHEYEGDDSEGLKDNPIYVSSGSGIVNVEKAKADSIPEYSQCRKRGKIEMKKLSKANKSKQRKKDDRGYVYENADDFIKRDELIYANENGGTDTTLEIIPKKNKDGLIYADLDLKPFTTERIFIIHGLENKNNYAIIDLSRNADPLPSDDEDDKEDIDTEE